MPSLLEIKNRISSTKSTQKITKAMQLVAASKMKTFQKTSISVRDYTQDLVQALRHGNATVSDTSLAEEREQGKTLFVLLTSDKGLCGAMNAKLIRTMFRSEDWTGLDKEDRLIITVGKKSAEAARAEKVNPVAAFAGINEQLEVIDALEIIHEITERWQSKEVKRVVLVSPEYVNPFVFNIRQRDYLPLTPKNTEMHLGESQDHEQPLEAAFMEPTREEVIEQLSNRVIEMLFIEAFFQLKATEYSSRMVAMKKATEAADTRIKELTIVYNKARQNSITQQLSELAAAGEAMNSEHQYEINEV